MIKVSAQAKINWLAGLVLLAALAIYPLLVDVEASYGVTFLFQAFLYVTIAQSWNLIAGYTGQVSLGQHAFFGVGAYAMGISWMAGFTGFMDPLAFVLAASAAALLGVLIGIPLLSKLRGDYFALGTLGLGEILRVVVTQGGSLTGGSTGLLLPSGAYTSLTPYYYTGLGLALGSTLLCWALLRSRLGLAFISIRDDEQAASVCGVPVLRYKIISLAISGALAGLAGSLYAYNTFQVMPDDVFGLQWCLFPVLMCIVGGMGSLRGPILGSFLLAGLFQLTSLYLPRVHPLISGTFIILFAMWLPKGLTGLVNINPAKVFARFWSASPTERVP